MVVRRTGSGGREVVLVHRPAYDDWSLPKGKLEPGEGLLWAAAREIHEETGLRCLLGPALGTVEYVDSKGRDKTVHYWTMASADDRLAPTKEIDDARWLPFDEAALCLTHELDREVLARAPAVLPDADEQATIFLVRHAEAGDRSKWEGHDVERPLTAHGREQAEALAAVLAARAPAVLVTSRAVRCVQTLEPLGEAVGLPVQEHEGLFEGVSLEDALAVLGAAGTLGTAVVSTHGDIQAPVIESLEHDGVQLSRPLRFAKGSTWELTLEDGRFVAGTYAPPPA